MTVISTNGAALELHAHAGRGSTCYFANAPSIQGLTGLSSQTQYYGQTSDSEATDVGGFSPFSA